jgi:predicted PurR-regulated permease PerM
MKTFPSTLTTTSDRLTNVLSYGALLLLGYVVYLIFEPFLVPLTWSAVLAIFFYPVHERLARRLKPNYAAMMSTVGVTVLLIAPTLVVLSYTAKQAIDATARLQTALMNPERELPAEVVARVRAEHGNRSIFPSRCGRRPRGLRPFWPANSERWLKIW